MAKKTKRAKRPKTKAKSKPGTITRWIIFLFLAGIISTSIYLLKQPDPSPKKKNIPPPKIQTKIKTKTVYVNLYFLDPDSDYLIPEKRKVVFKKGDIGTQAKIIVEELIKGPKTNSVQTIPSGVIIKSIKIKKDGLAVIDFSRELSRNHPGGSLAEMQTIYSIVNSLLLNISSLKEVQILVDGNSRETLKGHLELGSPLQSNPSLIKKG